MSRRRNPRPFSRPIHEKAPAAPAAEDGYHCLSVINHNGDKDWSVSPQPAYTRLAVRADMFFGGVFPSRAEAEEAGRKFMRGE